MQYIGSNIRFIFTKIKELLNSHNTDNSAHSELFNSWTLLRNPTNAEIADALAVTHKNGIGDVLVEVANTQTFALEDIKLFFRPAKFQSISATDSRYEGIYITMDGTHGRYVAETFADSEIMMPEGPTTISTPSELVLYPAASDAVLYTPQTLTEEQQEQARTNIGALDVNVGTTPVDTNRTFFGVGKNIVYVKNGWLKPCPADADKELAANYANAVLGFGFINLDISVVKGEAKSAFSLYQQGLISDKGTILKNPLDVAQYITWTVGITNNKTYIDYRHVEHNGFYEYCRYFEDDTYSNLRASYSLSNYMSDSEPRGSVSQFRMSTAPTEDMHIATKQYVDTAKTEAQQLGLTTATPGKTIKVKTVQDGKPTEWEVANIYEKPESGIPKTDLAADVQTSLAKADTSISYDSQTLTEAQQAQARANIGAGQPVFAVNVTEVSGGGGYTADKTAAEIEAAYQAGRTIVCKTQARFLIGYIPVELPLVSRHRERDFTFAVDQLVRNGIFTITVNISDSGVEVSTKAVNIYEKPTSGIPKTDLEQSVQTSLAKADTSISYNSQTLTDEQKSQARTNIGVGQPDWNQNDSTQPDYVKNRPFYTGNPVETVLVEESTVSFAEDRGLYGAQIQSSFAATVGETYKVSWDGTTYECTCVDFRNTPAIGNLSIAGAGSDTGEPFLMIVNPGGRIRIGTADTSASHTISISGYAESVVKIDQKYLPVASETEPGIISITPLSNYILQQVQNEYFTELSTQVSDYGDAATIKEYANTNNSRGIFSSGKLDGAVLSCYDTANEHITFVLSGGKNIECWKFSQGSTTMERLWGISEDGVFISSSTPDSTKKFRITVDDSGVPTITDESDSTNTWKPTNLPTVTSSDSGKLLRVSDTGEWVAETILSATVSNNTLIIR